MAYDALDGYFLLFGGMTCDSAGTCITSNDTWSYNGTGWTELFPSVEPPARVAAMMTYDPSDQSVLLFGGITDVVTGNALNDTWEFAGGAWTETNNGTRSSPPPTWSGSLAYDANTSTAILFGGCCGSGAIFDSANTWRYAHGNWSAVASAGAPPPREGAGLFYDPFDGGLILVGGGYCDDQECVDYQDTWLLKDGTWTGLNPLRQPNASEYMPVFYDPALNAGVLVDDNGYTWLYVADDWGPATTMPSKTGMTNAAFAMGPPNGTAIALGSGPGWVYGYYTGMASNATVTLEGTPHVPFGANFTVSSRGLDVGQPFQVTVSAWGGSWSYRFLYTGYLFNCDSIDAPLLSCVFWAAGAYQINATVTDSGGNTTSMNWSIAVRSVPSVRISVSPAVVDLGQPIEFAANLSGGSPPPRFAWVGMPPGSCQNVSNSVGACFPPTGLWTIQGRYCDNQGLCAISSPVNVLVNAVLTVQLVSFPSQIPGDFQSVFYADISGGTSPYHFHWTFGDGASEDTTSPVATHTFAFPGPWTNQVLVGDAVSNSNTSTESLQFNATAFPPPPPSVTVRSSAALIDLGGEVAIVGQVSSGTPPYAFSWTGLPPGCDSNGTLTVTCSPTAAGEFSVALVAVDHLGAHGSASTIITVEPALVPVISIASTTSCGLSAARATLTATVTGGMPPYRFSWSFGDGTGSSSAGPISHTFPYSARNYTVQLTVGDALNTSASTLASLAATAPTGCSTTVIRTTPPGPAISVEELGMLVGGASALALVAGWALRNRYGPKATRNPHPP